MRVELEVCHCACLLKHSTAGRSGFSLALSLQSSNAPRRIDSGFRTVLNCKGLAVRLHLAQFSDVRAPPSASEILTLLSALFVSAGHVGAARLGTVAASPQPRS